MDSNAVASVIKSQREFFKTGKTKSLEFRKQQLEKLRDTVKTNEPGILRALHQDLGKPELEAYVGEIALLYDETKFALKNLNHWAAPKKVSTPLASQRASSWIHSEPLGVALIIGPWNYPFQLVVAPLIAAIAAGNCAILKPSELAPETSRIIAHVIREAFEKNYVAVFEGGVAVSEALLAEKFDHIFFTGGTQVGKIVAMAAAKHLTPCTLELGGKSPCLVDETIDLEVTARRITWGKFFNAGQTCVAPDYLLVPESKKEELLTRIKAYVEKFFTTDPSLSPDYGRIISDRHFDRLVSFLEEGKALFGGKHDKGSRYIAPTVLDAVSKSSRVMSEEIFGPILPVLTYRSFDEALALIGEHPNPLALYLFSTDSERQERVLRDIAFGGGCINDTLLHLSNPRLPFGGVGESGIGAYHGEYGFATFSHKKSVVRRGLFPDFAFRYPPYVGKLAMVKRFLG